MTRATALLRRFGVLALGAVLLVVGAVLLALPTPDAGWTAYAPLTHQTFRPVPATDWTFLTGAFLAGAGLALAATGIWLAIARRRAAVRGRALS